MSQLRSVTVWDQLRSLSRRAMHWSHMDFEAAASLLFLFLVRPKQAYKRALRRRDATQRPARDDPAFLVLMVLFLCAISVSYSLALAGFSFFSLLRSIFVSNALFLGTGFIGASVTWVVTRRYMAQNSRSSSDIDWLYCFDVHCNASVSAWGIGYLLPFPFLPILVSSSFLATIAGNVICLLAALLYLYVSFRGFSDPGYMHEPAAIAAPGLICMLVYLLATVFDWNIIHSFWSFIIGV